MSIRYSAKIGMGYMLDSGEVYERLSLLDADVHDEIIDSDIFHPLDTMGGSYVFLGKVNEISEPGQFSEVSDDILFPFSIEAKEIYVKIFGQTPKTFQKIYNMLCVS